jgi:predicted RNase H-like nuclease (RuvC/YqgF family)
MLSGFSFSLFGIIRTGSMGMISARIIKGTPLESQFKDTKKNENSREESNVQEDEGKQDQSRFGVRNKISGGFQ